MDNGKLERYLWSIDKRRLAAEVIPHFKKPAAPAEA